MVVDNGGRGSWRWRLVVSDGNDGGSCDEEMAYKYYGRFFLEMPMVSNFMSACPWKSHYRFQSPESGLDFLDVRNQASFMLVMDEISGTELILKPYSESIRTFSTA
ncbi:hypothetical protein HAX54_034360 [Datura stramonium]|uniref:Uncharacterized protein n=1 Tax=Datura stramonium TaxID=4076 RepID=A0ABS8VGG9_DATST|nr:hypothetical protein [Datura stramonium]